MREDLTTEPSGRVVPALAMVTGWGAMTVLGTFAPSIQRVSNL